MPWTTPQRAASRRHLTGRNTQRPVRTVVRDASSLTGSAPCDVPEHGARRSVDPALLWRPSPAQAGVTTEGRFPDRSADRPVGLTGVGALTF